MLNMCVCKMSVAYHKYFYLSFFTLVLKQQELNSIIMLFYFNPIPQVPTSKSGRAGDEKCGLV